MSQEIPVPKAVIFDLDGTLIISTVNFRKFRERLIEYMIERDAEMSRYNRNETTVSMISKFEQEMRDRGVEEEEIQRYLDEIDSILNDIELERIEDTKPVTDARKLLETLRKNNIRIGVLTRGCAEYAHRTLEITGLDVLVDEVVSRDRSSGIAAKPDPTSALLLTERLGVKPDESVMIGDHSIDYNCAQNSGIRFFGIVSDDRSREDLTDCGCEDIVVDFNEFLSKIGISRN